MLNSLLRKILLDAIASGPPYRVSTRYLGVPKMMQLLAELERRRLITSFPCSVLTEAGIAEAKWLHVCPLQRDDEIYDGWPADQRLRPMADSCRSKNGGAKARDGADDSSAGLGPPRVTSAKIGPKEPRDHCAKQGR